MTELDEIVSEFLVESHENLDQLDRDLLALEQDPNSRELLSSVFRTIHTIKGTSGFLAFGQLEAISHVGENLLSKLRDGALVLSSEITDALLAMVDAIRQLLRTIEATGLEGQADHAALIATLERLLVPGAAEAPAAEVPQAAAPVEESPAAEPAPAEPAPAKPKARRAPRKKPAAKAAAKPADPAPQVPAADIPTVIPHQIGAGKAPLIGEVLLEQGLTQSDVSFGILAQEVGDARPLGEILVDSGITTPQDVSSALETQTERRSIADSSIRVDVDLLDSLMRLVGELVLTRNQIVAQAIAGGDPGLVRASTRLNLIASELQGGVMKTRMQAIDTVWNKLPRVIRDLGATCGKSVRLEMEGRDTELDKTILEAVKDPLTHLVRNAVDHGIETPEARIAAGKPAEGTLLLRAFHEGGQVNIEIRDNGAGIDPAKVAAKALEKGLVTHESLARMNERQLTALIFLPGFSTAAAITNVSGRGVGMDVVKTNIERIGGTVDVTSVLGEGSTFRIKIPLTLAIIPALTVTCAGDRYAIPQISLVELVRLDGESARSGVEMISGTPVHRLRGNLLPLVHLDSELGLVPPLHEPADTLYIVVLQAEDRQFGLVVDDVLDTEEIVVKPLSSQLKGVPAYAGATILGDGRVALILDVLSIAQQSHVLRADRDRALEDRGDGNADQLAQRESLLVVACGPERRMAIPLAMVTRLEEFPPSAIEHVGSREVVQYRGKILPLVRLGSLLGAYSDADPDDDVSVVVYSEGDRSVGIVVDQILDVVEETITDLSDVDDIGLTGSLVIHDRITELLDVRSAVLAADAHFFDAPVGADFGG
ncbi:MAG: chemotaxis protein CheA [Actinomycetota bacterium]|nr:chemotaxis protein CheA [Actinomycetota bacterium]